MASAYDLNEMEIMKIMSRHVSAMNEMNLLTELINPQPS